jgi:hypothetical protein
VSKDPDVSLNLSDDAEKRHSKFVHDFEMPPVIIYHVF